MEKFKKFTAWSEAHAIKQLCDYLNSKKYNCGLDFEYLAKEMLSEISYRSEKCDNKTDWTEKGKGISAHGDYGKEYGYTFRLELHDVEDSKKHKYMLEVTFYIYLYNC